MLSPKSIVCRPLWMKLQPRSVPYSGTFGCRAAAGPTSAPTSSGAERRGTLIAPTASDPSREESGPASWPLAVDDVHAVTIVTSAAPKPCASTVPTDASDLDRDRTPVM